MAYRIGRPSAGDEFVVVALEEATLEVDKAIKSTVDNLFSGSRSITNSTPAELLRLFRYPPESQRGLARSAEIYERTLQLVAEKVRTSHYYYTASKFRTTHCDFTRKKRAHF